MDPNLRGRAGALTPLQEVDITTRPAGGVVLDRIRERIHHGRFFGATRPGDRLPSIREIAQAEHVNRKTVAAAYLHLQREGLVQIRPRSGIYLNGEGSHSATRTLDRLRAKWLEQMYAGARAVGLDTSSILQIAHAVAAVERTRFPVIAATMREAQALAAELSQRLSLHALPLAVNEVDFDAAALTDAPVVICTPWFAATAARRAPHATVVPATLSEELVQVLRRGGAGDGLLLVVTPDEEVARRVREGLSYSGWRANGETVVVTLEDTRGRMLERFRISRVLYWPGIDERLVSILPQTAEQIRGLPLLAHQTVNAIQRAVLEEALRRVGPLPGPEQGIAQAP